MNRQIPLSWDSLPAEQQHTSKISLIVDECSHYLMQMADESVHLVVTDPPYFLDGLDDNWSKGGRKKYKSLEKSTIGTLPPAMKFDPQQGVQLQSFMEKIGKGLHKVLMPGGFAVVFGQPRLIHRLALGLELSGFEIRDLCIWHYTNKSQFKAFGMNHFIDKSNWDTEDKEYWKEKLRGLKTPQLRPQFEAIVLAQKPRQGTFVDNWMEYETGLMDATVSLDGNVPSNVMRVDKADKIADNNHLTVKPVRLIKHLIQLFSREGQVVLDPFVGSGTTAVAAQETGRDCIGIDINSSYIDIAQKRLREQVNNAEETERHQGTNA